MQLKLVRIHDNGVAISVLAIRLNPTNDMEREMLVEHAGHRADGGSVLLVELDSESCTTDPVRWATMGIHPRTLPVAHDLLVRQFENVPDGQVIDIGELLKDKPPEHDGGPVDLLYGDGMTNL